MALSIATAQSSWTEVTTAPTQSGEAKLEILSQSQPFTATIAPFEAESHGPVSCDPATSMTLFEDFSNNLIGDNSVSNCAPVFDCNTDDVCFAPNGIQCGFTITNIQDGSPINELGLLTTGQFGSALNFVGPFWFSDDFVLTLDAPSPDVSFDFASFFGDELVDLDISDEFGNPIGIIQVTTTTLDMPTAITISAVGGNIGEITFRDFDLNVGMVISDLSFCVPPTVPTLGEWAIICLGLMMLIFGVVYISASSKEVVTA